MLDTFLFDLDGTLLPMDMNKFMEIYFHEMGKAFEDIIEPQLLAKHIWASTEEMVKNLECKTNETVFMNRFSKLINVDMEVYSKRFDKFYDEGFLRVQQSVFDSPLIRDAVMQLKSKGYNMVIATNPLFPQKAIYHRIKWAGLNTEDFIHITSYEHSHYCKPQLNYYREVLEKIGKVPEQCMMVGNDVQEDMVAGSLGMQTFLITNHIIHRTEDEVSCTYKGNYEDFYEYVKKLTPLKRI